MRERRKLAPAGKEGCMHQNISNAGIIGCREEVADGERMWCCLEVEEGGGE